MAKYITEQHIKRIADAFSIFIIGSILFCNYSGHTIPEKKEYFHTGITAGSTETVTTEIYKISESEEVIDAVSLYLEELRLEALPEKVKKMEGIGYDNGDIGTEIPITNEETVYEPEFLTPTVASTYDVPNWEEPCHSEAFTYMGYDAVHTRTTTQWRILNADYAYTDETYGIRCCHTLWGDRYYVAIGQGYNAPAGTLINVILEDGSSIPCVVGDLKKWTECDENHMYHMLGDGSVVEIVVDYEYFGRNSEQYRPLFHGKVLQIEVCEEHI